MIDKLIDNFSKLTLLQFGCITLVAFLLWGVVPYVKSKAKEKLRQQGISCEEDYNSILPFPKEIPIKDKIIIVICFISAFVLLVFAVNL